MHTTRECRDLSPLQGNPVAGQSRRWTISLSVLLCFAVVSTFLLISGDNARATLQLERGPSPLAMVKLGNRYINLGAVSTIVESGAGGNQATIEVQFLGDGQGRYNLEGAEAAALIRFLHQNVTDITPPESKSVRRPNTKSPIGRP